MTREVAMSLLVTLTACGGPVHASNCEIISAPKQSTLLRAILTNDSPKPVKHVGVLVGVLEYEFAVRLEPYQTSPLLVGTEISQSGPHIPNEPDMARVTQTMRGRVPDDQCWARWVDFTDGTNWNVSPL
jgi:hypothetical protein